MKCDSAMLMRGEGDSPFGQYSSTGFPVVGSCRSLLVSDPAANQPSAGASSAMQVPLSPPMAQEPLTSWVCQKAYTFTHGSSSTDPAPRSQSLPAT
ncbi:hypothetical protein EYF80_020762 [Liparis tanakae]|uniref:Uncharacterized protein n=1 Tax=Liparis tanakae TaxID=230148 RepID=A0A4Z2HTC6_9TELE|nr:hypothetical protein EYF80_020762 [Liparis tanakae]